MTTSDTLKKAVVPTRWGLFVVVVFVSLVVISLSSESSAENTSFARVGEASSISGIHLAAPTPSPSSTLFSTPSFPPLSSTPTPSPSSSSTPPPPDPYQDPIDNSTIPGCGKSLNPLTKLNIFRQARCHALSFFRDWWNLLGKAVLNSTQFRPQGVAFGQIYEWQFYLAIPFMIMVAIWNMVMTLKKRESMSQALHSLFIFFPIAILVAMYLPAIFYMIEYYFIDPATRNYIHLQSLDVTNFIAAMFSSLSSSDIVGGTVTASIIGFLGGLGAFCLFFIITIRNVGLSLFGVISVWFLIGTMSHQRWHAVRKPVQWMGALFLSKVVISLILYVGIHLATEMTVAKEDGGSGISSLLIGLVIIFLVIAAFPLLMSLIGGMGDGMTHQAAGQASNLIRSGATAPVRKAGTAIANRRRSGKANAASSTGSLSKGAAAGSGHPGVAVAAVGAEKLNAVKKAPGKVVGSHSSVGSNANGTPAGNGSSSGSTPAGTYTDSSGAQKPERRSQARTSDPTLDNFYKLNREASSPPPRRHATKHKGHVS